MALRRVLRSKLHMARVTHADLNYEGSITIDEDLMDLAGIARYEFVLVSNMENGERFETYVIPGSRGSGEVCLNGATARKGVVGDRIFVFCTEFLGPEELRAHKPKVVILSEDNKPVRVI